MVRIVEDTMGKYATALPRNFTGCVADVQMDCLHRLLAKCARPFTSIAFDIPYIVKGLDGIADHGACRRCEMLQGLEAPCTYDRIASNQLKLHVAISSNDKSENIDIFVLMYVEEMCSHFSKLSKWERSWRLKPFFQTLIHENYVYFYSKANLKYVLNFKFTSYNWCDPQKGILWNASQAWIAWNPQKWLTQNFSNPSMQRSKS